MNEKPKRGGKKAYRKQGSGKASHDKCRGGAEESKGRGRSHPTDDWGADDDYLGILGSDSEEKNLPPVFKETIERVQEEMVSDDSSNGQKRRSVDFGLHGAVRQQGDGERSGGLNDVFKRMNARGGGAAGQTHAPREAHANARGRPGVPPGRRPPAEQAPGLSGTFNAKDRPQRFLQTFGGKSSEEVSISDDSTSHRDLNSLQVLAQGGRIPEKKQYQNTDELDEFQATEIPHVIRAPQQSATQRGPGADRGKKPSGRDRVRQHYQQNAAKSGQWMATRDDHHSQFQNGGRGAAAGGGRGRGSGGDGGGSGGRGGKKERGGGGGGNARSPRTSSETETDEEARKRKGITKQQKDAKRRQPKAEMTIDLVSESESESAAKPKAAAAGRKGRSDLDALGLESRSHDDGCRPVVRKGVKEEEEEEVEELDDDKKFREVFGPFDFYGSIAFKGSCKAGRLGLGFEFEVGKADYPQPSEEDYPKPDWEQTPLWECKGRVETHSNTVLLSWGPSNDSNVSLHDERKYRLEKLELLIYYDKVAALKKRSVVLIAQGPRRRAPAEIEPDDMVDLMVVVLKKMKKNEVAKNNLKARVGRKPCMKNKLEILSADNCEDKLELFDIVEFVEKRERELQEEAAAKEEDNVVQLTSPDSGLRRSKRTRSNGSRSTRYTSILDDEEVEAKLLFKYPPGYEDADRVTLTNLDLERVTPGEFLNDNIIDFYFKFYVREKLPAGIRAAVMQDVHIFSTHFFSKLTEPPPLVVIPKKSKKSPEEKKKADVKDTDEDLLEDVGEVIAETARKSIDKKEEAALKKEEGYRAAHALVQRWTKNFDLFSKKMVLVPINEALHWSLAVICNLDQIFNLKEPVKNLLSKKRSPAKGRGSSGGGGGGGPEGGSAPRRIKTRRSGGSMSRDGAVAASDWREEEEGGTQRSSPPVAETHQTLDEDSLFGPQVGRPSKEEEGGQEVLEVVDESEETSTGKANGDRRHRHAASPSQEEKGEDEEEPQVLDEDGVDADDGDQKMPALSSPQEADAHFGGQPCIIFMDSLNAHRADKIHTYLVKYLEMEWRKRKPNEALPAIQKETIRMVKPRVPTQENSCDCGIFVLMYGEKMLEKLDQISRISEEDVHGRLSNHLGRDDFSLQDVADKRTEIEGLFKRLEKEHLERGGGDAAAVVEGTSRGAAADEEGEEEGVKVKRKNRRKVVDEAAEAEREAEAMKEEEEEERERGEGSIAKSEGTETEREGTQEEEAGEGEEEEREIGKKGDAAPAATIHHRVPSALDNISLQYGSDSEVEAIEPEEAPPAAKKKGGKSSKKTAESPSPIKGGKKEKRGTAAAAASASSSSSPAATKRGQEETKSSPASKKRKGETYFAVVEVPDDTEAEVVEVQQEEEEKERMQESFAEAGVSQSPPRHSHHRRRHHHHQQQQEEEEGSVASGTGGLPLEVAASREFS